MLVILNFTCTYYRMRVYCSVELSLELRTSTFCISFFFLNQNKAVILYFIIYLFPRSDACELMEADVKMIRHSLLGLIRYYVYRQITHKELASILSFIASVQDEVLVSVLMLWGNCKGERFRE